MTDVIGHYLENLVTYCAEIHMRTETTNLLRYCETGTLNLVLAAITRSTWDSIVYSATIWAYLEQRF